MGNYKAGMKDGYGEFNFTASDGSVYRGQWKRDQMAGKGTLTTREGRSYKLLNGKQLK